MQITFERLEKWPNPETYPRTSRYRFKASYPTIKADLESEIERINGYNVLIEADIPPRGILRSGWPGSDARSSSHPGVRLSFTIDTRQGTVPTVLEFACDEYNGWQANLRGISLTLEALRDIKRSTAIFALGNRCQYQPPQIMQCAISTHNAANPRIPSR